MLQHTTRSLARISGPPYLRAAAMATSHRLPASLSNAAAAATVQSPLAIGRTIHTTALARMSSTVFTFRLFDNDEKFLGHQRDLATRGLHQQSSASPSPFEEANSTSNDAHLSFSSSSSESSSHQHQQDQTLPTVQITRDSTSLIITPPRGSRFSASHTPSHEPSSTTITAATARTLEYTWLRDNCPCPKCLHAPTRQKLHSTEQVPRDISVSSIQVYEHGLEVTWSKGLQIPQARAGVVDVEEEEDVGKEALLLKAQPGHQSFYPWELIFAR